MPEFRRFLGSIPNGIKPEFEPITDFTTIVVMPEFGRFFSFSPTVGMAAELKTLTEGWWLHGGPECRYNHEHKHGARKPPLPPPPDAPFCVVWIIVRCKAVFALRIRDLMVWLRICRR
jgi:hypothetical protein